jgi:predicted anti-sigma-YlaC factor YlaD
VITDCAKMREMAPELALGVLVGAERGEALAHLAGCAECRHLVDELSEAADALLLLAAEAEPSLGFESRVLARLAADQPRRRPWRWIANAAAAALLAAAATGIVVHQVDGRSDDLHLRAAELRAATGKDTGDVYVMAGRPAWVFMSVTSTETGRSYMCELDFADGHVVRAGKFTVADREGWWGTAVKTGIDDLRSVRLLAPDGTTIASADFN